MVAFETRIVHEAKEFSHEHADHLSRLASGRRNAKWVVIDLSKVEQATTSAFARLVLLRRSLLKEGRDLRLANLRDRAAGLFEVNRLDAVLPRV